MLLSTTGDLAAPETYWDRNMLQKAKKYDFENHEYLFCKP